MPRRKRRIVPGVTYHLISRFVAREWFVNTASERRLYLELLGKSLRRVSWRCLGSEIMSSHVHLAAVAGHEPLADWVRSVHGPFADALDRERKRIGAVFVRGPKDLLVPDSDVGRVLAYLHNNPVCAGVISDPAQSDWTSHRCYLGLAEAPPWLAVPEGLARTGLNADAFNTFVVSSTGHPVLGDVTSNEEIKALIDAYERAQLAAERPEVVRTVEPLHVLVVVAEVMKLSIAVLQSKRRGELECRGRVVAITCRRRLGCSAQELARVLQVTPRYVNRCWRAPVNDRVLLELVDRVLDVLA